ncbi:MAG TPA: hypothetical protein VKA16_03755 [Burkholderiales bacterium]|nr:hypothetical protein [Burkholderiales bacterium]
MKGLILAATLLATMPGAWARDATGSFETVGAKSCGSFLQDRQAHGWAYDADTAWVTGYVTAYNALTPDTGNILGDTDVSGAMLWLQNYCKANPSNDLAEGMLALTAELYPRRHRTRQ